MKHTPKQKLGALVIDWPRFEWSVRTRWLEVKNRKERLEASPDGRGVDCRWPWTSDLHVAKVFPALGRRLAQRAFRDWPIGFAQQPAKSAGAPRVSFVIGHRGRERVPQLKATLSTIAAQEGVAFECIVVEQSLHSEVRDALPEWVNYLHTPISHPRMPYCRSWTLNAGARVASGEVLVLHDNDMLVPRAYASEILARYASGYEVINLKRFVFYLAESDSRAIASNRSIEIGEPMDAVVQNLEAGGSVAVSRDAYMAIGGYDESFVGWGGEDNEFWERAQTRRVWPFGYLPILHLWHSSQPRKRHASNPTAQLLAQRSAIAADQRIRELIARPFGDPACLSVEWQASRGT